MSGRDHCPGERGHWRRDPDSDSSDASISADGRYVAFDSFAFNLVHGDGNGVTDVFVRDLVAGTTVRVSMDQRGGDPKDSSFLPSISADGRSVAFSSNATDLVGTRDKRGKFKGLDIFVSTGGSYI